MKNLFVVIFFLSFISSTYAETFSIASVKGDYGFRLEGHDGDYWHVGTGVVNFSGIPTIDPDLEVPVGQFNGVFTRQMMSGSCKERVKGMYRVFSDRTGYLSGSWKSFEDFVENGLNNCSSMVGVFNFKFVVVNQHKTLEASDYGNTHFSGTFTLQ